MIEGEVRGFYEGWSRGFYSLGGEYVDAYHRRIWGRDLYVEAVLVDVLDEDKGAALLRSVVAKMLAETGPETA